MIEINLINLKQKNVVGIEINNQIEDYKYR